MAGKTSQLIPSGIEPIDRILGGLHTSRLYLAHGEATSCSLFGVLFAIEGLKRGEHAAMVIASSPEDAVRQFARLGYDCLEDVYSGRLVILEYSGDIIDQIKHINVLAPVLKELEWLFGETHPKRIVFDTVDKLLAGKDADPLSRANEVALWAGQFGATVLLIAGNGGSEALERFTPLVEESFGFELKEKAEKKVRFITFEKDDSLLSQKIEIDPSRGIFLVEGISQKDDSFVFIDDVETMADDDQPKTDLSKDSAPAQTVEVEDIEWPLELIERPAFYFQLPFDLLEETEAEKPVQDISLVSNYRVSTEPPIEDSDESRVDVILPISDQQEPEVDLNWLDELIAEITEELPPADEDVPSVITVSDTESASSVLPDPLPLSINTADTIVEHAPITATTIDYWPVPIGETEQPLTTILSDHAANQPIVKLNSSEATHVSPNEFTVLLVHGDPAECEAMAQSLDQYNIDIVHDGLSALSRLISLKPDLVILGIDLPIIDGFEVLSHIRRSLNVPVIAISATRVRAGDRILAAEMGADYYLTKPYSSKELRQKARQLIARYRGVNSWIVTSNTSAIGNEKKSNRRGDASNLPRTTENGLFLPYEIFSAEVEVRVKNALERGPAISIVGCSLPHMASEGGRIALQLFDLMRATVRDTDRISSDQKNDLVILLPDADSNGGQAFARRLRERVRTSLHQDPAIWLRSFPDLQQTAESTPSDVKLTNGHKYNRRAGDKKPMSNR